MVMLFSYGLPARLSLLLAAHIFSRELHESQHDDPLLSDFAISQFRNYER